ncbi:hypothetical protein ACI2LF_03020 [Kribbella sp. NPDC020789]
MSSQEVPRPRTLTIAYALWLIVAAYLILGGGFLVFSGWLTALDATRLTIRFAVVVLGFFVWGTSAAVAGGRDSRAALLVLGVLSCFTILPILFVVPAVVLQYTGPARRWFELPA